MTHPKHPLVQQLNSSGFPFQLRVEQEISRSASKSGWQIITREHHWEHPASGRSGYIDIVAGYGMVRLVIECKRAAESSWLFLVPDSNIKEMTRVRSFCTVFAGQGSFQGYDWCDLNASPQSHESMFCIAQGQSAKEPMLERMAGELIQSVEALAFEEARLAAEISSANRRIYLPAVVTAAELNVCLFTSSSVSVERGRLETADFTRVPHLRFRKGMAQNLSTKNRGSDLGEANLRKERSLFVIQAKELAGFLQAWNIKPLFGDEWPHYALAANN